MKRYRFLEEADAEFQEHISYYDQQASGLGDRFIEDVDRLIRIIRRWPESGVRVAKNVRKRVLRVFKFGILYVDEPDEIIIVAIAHHKRRPGYWRKRLRKLRRQRRS